MNASILCNNESMTMPMRIDDGGRAEAGYKGETGDCVTRAFAIASGLSYQSIYDLVNELGREEKPRRIKSGDGYWMANITKSSARTGVKKETSRKLAEVLGFSWTPTMKIGSGCTVHLRADELPGGIIVVQLSKHVAAVIDGVLHDTYDCSRDGTRCVYGYWTRP